VHSNVTSKNVSGFTLAGPPCTDCNTTRPSVLSVRALVRVRVSVTIITRRGSCGFCPNFVTTIYTWAHRRWWRVSTV